MSRIKLKKSDRPKALWGEAIIAGATLAAAGMQVGATASAASKQADATIESAKQQASAIQQQNINNTNLQKESMEFTRQQNAEIKQQNKDIQTTLQMLAGQQNMNDIMEQNKKQVKYGGRPKRRKLKREVNSTHFYGGGNMPFRVTDGGGVIPIAIDSQGYGLYELFGNDHEHYHKTRGGKNKTGVGIKFANGEEIEGEGNQNTNQGELMYVTPEDAMFLSKHSIDGFNPTKAVQSGMAPEEAFAYQEAIKDIKGYNDDGTQVKCGGRKKLKAMMGIYNPIGVTTRNQFNVGDIAAIASGAAYVKQQEDNNSPVAKCGKRISLRRKALEGTKTTNNWFKNYWNDYGGATITAAGNLFGAGISAIGNAYASNKLSNAYAKAGNILSNAYSNLKTIDSNFLNRDDFNQGTAIAAIQSPGYRNTAMRERLRRNNQAEIREINRGTLSSAARQQKLAGAFDRSYQRLSELAEQERNQNQQIIQGNMQRITDTSATNAQMKAQATKDYYALQTQIAQYNNDIENMKIAGAAQALADAGTQSATVRANSLQSSMQGLGNALASSGQAFGSVFDSNRTFKQNLRMTYAGADDANIVRSLVMNNDDPNNRAEALRYFNYYKDSNNENFKEYAKQLATAYNFNYNSNDDIYSFDDIQKEYYTPYVRVK